MLMVNHGAWYNMASCCSTSNNDHKKHVCPVNGQNYLFVPLSTVLQHLIKPWKRALPTQNYYFCSDPKCDVVYFGEDDSVIKKSALRGLVGIKETENDDALACYCFDITHAEAKQDSKLRTFVIEQTKANLCSCETKNPSGKCCLKDFPKNIQKVGGCTPTPLNNKSK